MIKTRLTILPILAAIFALFFGCSTIFGQAAENIEQQIRAIEALPAGSVFTLRVTDDDISAAANEYLDLGLYFNNKSLKQANAFLEPFEKTGYRYSYPNGYQPYKYWGWDMVIQFGDESTYSTMANYFSKSNFRSVYGDIESLMESYSKLIKK